MVVVSSREIMPTNARSMRRLVGREKGVRRCNDGRGCHEEGCRRVELHDRMMVQRSVTLAIFGLSPWLFKLLLLRGVLRLLVWAASAGYHGASLSSTKSSGGGGRLDKELSK
jgi:hypothetical protein